MDCFPDWPEGNLRDFFLCVSFTFSLVPSSNKETVAGGGFSVEPDMSCVCLGEVMA